MGKYIYNPNAANQPYAQITEPDMRNEMGYTLYGRFPEIPKGQVHVFRKMRRDANGQLISCPCTDPVTGEPDKDNYCPICMGEGYIWDEVFFTGYKEVLKSDVGNAQRERLLEPGLINIPIVVFFTDEPHDFTKYDKIVEIARDHAGNPIRPYKRTFIYTIDAPIDLRSDNGKLEYWKLTCFSVQRKFLNGPTG